MSHTPGNAATVLAHVAGRLGAELRSARPLSGGDINDAFRVGLSDGREVFVKLNSRAPQGLFLTEARGLAWLAEAEAIRVPQVLAVEDGPQAFLCLELLDATRPCKDFDERLGRQLAELHRCSPSGFGLDHDNFIGRLPQDNRGCPTWVDFYRERRLEPQIQRAVDSGSCGGALQRRLATLVSDLEERVGPAEPPARLHGDLWGGNLHRDARGQPALIDPAAYGGHREVDLAMMRLFGGFSERVFAAYDEHYPLAPGAERRVPLYQLYPLLVHVNHFGAGYLGQLEVALSQLE